MGKNIIISKTERLIIRHLEAGDAAFVKYLVNTPGWLQYIGDRQVQNEKDALKYMTKAYIDSYKIHGFGMYLVSKIEDEIAVGLCGLIKRQALDDVDLGFAMAPEYEGKGFAYESSVAVMKHAYHSLGIKKLLAITAPVNPRSANLLQRLGFVESGMMDFMGEQTKLYSHEPTS